MAYMNEGKRSYDTGSCFDIVSEELTIGPSISQNVSKVLDDCVRSLVENRPPSRKEKNKARVRRPMNAFMIYSQTARKAVAKNYPTLSYRKLSKTLGKIWKVLSREQKEPFEKEAERLRRLHKQEYPDCKFYSSRSRKPRTSKTTASPHCNPSIQDLWDLIQGGTMNGSSDQDLGEVGNNRYVNFAERTNFDDTLKSKQCQNNSNNYFNSPSFQVEASATWSAFGFDGRSIPSLNQTNDISSFEDQILPLIDYIPNDTSVTNLQSYECKTSVTLQAQHENEAIPVDIPSSCSVNQDCTNGYAPLLNSNNGFLTSFGDSTGETAFPNAMNHFKNCAEDDNYKFQSTLATTLYPSVLDTHSV